MPASRSERAASIAASVVLIGLLAGCAASPQEDYSDARAQLDAESSQINLPLEAYAMSAAETREVEHANALLTADCMAVSGRDFPRALQDWDALPTLPDRRYGLWSPADAEANGYEFPQAADSEAISAQEDSFESDWWEAAQECLTSDTLLPLLGVNSSPEQSPVDRGLGESYEALLASDVFKQTREEWRSCIEAEGLSLHADARVLIPQFPSAGEQQLRVAAIDVGCKEQLNSVQVLADFEARQQLAYVDGHESELIAYRERVDDVLERAREVLATRGG